MMFVYDVNGSILSTLYDIGAYKLEKAYNVNGNEVFSSTSCETPTGLIFEDDFDTFNTENWGYEIGYVRNNELQYYRAENVSIADSCLVITAKRETYCGKNWTSGSITGQKLQSWKYGKFEARCKFPGLVGSFPAFWTLGANHWIEYAEDGDSTVANSSPDGSVAWPACGEIDIVEGIPGNAITAQANLWKYSGGSLGAGRSGEINLADWHTYTMNWTSEYIAMSVDGVEYKRWTFSDYNDAEVQAYHLPHYIILNLAVGASGGTPSSNVDEMKMYVDWVRVYAPT